MYRSPEWECECGSVAYPEMVVDGAVVYRCVLCTKNFVIMDSEQPIKPEKEDECNTCKNCVWSRMEKNVIADYEYVCAYPEEKHPDEIGVQEYVRRENTYKKICVYH